MRSTIDQRNQGGEPKIVPAEARQIRCIDAVAKLESSERDERPAWRAEAGHEAPARQIAEHSSVDGGVVVARMMPGTGAAGFDAARKQYVDLHEAGSVDPTKVVRVALENAVSRGQRDAADGGDMIIDHAPGAAAVGAGTCSAVRTFRLVAAFAAALP